MRLIKRQSRVAANTPIDNGHATEGAAEPSPGSRGGSQATIAIAFAVGLLLLATTSQGAFQVSRWAPLALFVLAVLGGGLAIGPGLAVRSRPAALALAGIWGLAGWSMLSMLWAASPQDAFAAADRTILYAAIATLPFAFPASRRSLALVGWAITAGIGAIAVYVLVRLLTDGGALFLAGRLNGPINYRNATALLFAIAVPPCVVAAAGRSPRRALRAGALSLATLCLGLAFLTQSRGILLGLGAGELVILLLGPDRVRRAWVSVLPLGLVAVGSHSLLTPFHAFDGGSGLVTVHDITVAARGLLATTGAAFGLGLIVALFDSGIRPNSPRIRHIRYVARAALAIGALAAVLAVGVAIGNPAAYLRGKWDQFRSLQSTTPTTTRLLTVGGQRYDLWRVALDEFEKHPILGVGADNYEFGYYRNRRTDRNLSDPHSLVFATLSETGAVGLLLLLAFLVGIAAAVWSGWRRLDNVARRPLAAAAAAGMVLIGQSTVDWIWLIPGLTSIGVLLLALAAAQAALASPAPSGAAPLERPTGRAHAAAGRPLALAALALAAAALLALFLSDAYIQRARTDIAAPRSELSAARIASDLDPWSVTPHYLEASALESEGDRPAAFAQLSDALTLEPANFATLGVIGDFEARGHRFALARSYYRRALALDPLDTGLQQLSRLGLSRVAAPRRVDPPARRSRR
jgi:tetratricopeptide (TPR) repeat protein